MNNGTPKPIHEHAATDSALATMARNGNAAAWGILASRHYEPLFRWLWRLCGKHEVAEDLAQDAFMRAFTKIELFQEGTQFRAWLFRIGHNLWANHCRSMSRRGTTGLEAAAETTDPSPAADDPSRIVGDREEIDQLKNRMRELPQDWREALLMRAEGGLSFREIASIQSVTEETARWRVFKARQRLTSENNQMLEKLEEKG